VWKIRKIFWILIGIASLILLRIAPTIAQNILGVYILGGSINMTGNSTSTNYNYNFNYTVNYNASNQTAFTDLNMNGYSVWNGSYANFSRFNGSMVCIGNDCRTTWPAGSGSSESDPYWWANYTLLNGTWNTTYNSTYNTWAYNMTTQSLNAANQIYINYTNSSVNNVIKNALTNNTAINATILNATKIYTSVFCLNPSCLKNMTSNSTHIIIQNGG
jgi:hypothetical protein